MRTIRFALFAVLLGGCVPLSSQNPDPASAKSVALCGAQKHCPAGTVCREHACLRLQN
jgi:hypothetical protein